MFSDVLVPLTNNAGHASLTWMASDVFKYNKTTYHSSFSSISLISVQDFVERAEKVHVGVTSGVHYRCPMQFFPSTRES